MTRRRTYAAILACAALLGAGCGSNSEGKPIPRSQVTELQKQLNSIQDRFSFGDGACNDIVGDNLPSVRRTLGQIPDTVDADVRNALSDSFRRLFDLVSTDCKQTSGQETTPTETTPTTPTETTPTETTPTETTPTETTPLPTAPGQKKGKKNKGQGNGNGGGGAKAPGE